MEDQKTKTWKEYVREKKEEDKGTNSFKRINGSRKQK